MNIKLTANVGSVASMLFGSTLILCIGLTVWGLLHTSLTDASRVYPSFMLLSLIFFAASSRLACKSSLLVDAVAGLITLVLVPLDSHIFFGVRFHIQYIIGVALIMIGIVVTVGL